MFYNSFERWTYVEKTFLIVLCLLGLLIFPGVPCVYSSDSKAVKFNGIVSKVKDGDSFELRSKGEKVVIRLWGIDAPEWNQPYSKKAKSFLTRTILHRDVVVYPLYHDKYHRLVAVVFVDDNNVNQLLIEKGLAWVHIYYCDEKICSFWKDLQKKAQSEHQGLWKESKPVPPWDWKRKKS